MGGFECSTHRDKRGRRLDLIASTRHDQFAEEDYTRLMQLGLRSCRDGVRWHLIEPEPFKYDFSSLENQVKAAREGLILQPDPESGQGLLKTPLGRIHRNEFPVGRGIYISAGQVRIVQVAMPGVEGEGEG